MDYLRLTREERYQIQALVTRGSAIREIARQLERQPSTILRELKKGFSEESRRYSAYTAEQVTSVLRRRARPDLHRIRSAVERYVREKIELDWSPEQISGRMELERKGSVPSRPSIGLFREKESQRGNFGHICVCSKILEREGSQNAGKPGPTYLTG